MPAFRDLTGQQFGRWTVVRRGPNGGTQNHTRWWCRCLCGAEGLVLAGALVSGHSLSCGCLRRDRTKAAVTRHGYAVGRRPHSLYTTWAGMIQRCENPRSSQWPWYGARGITVHGPWHDFATFARDVTAAIGERPSRKHSIDRLDVNGPYAPGNIRWATHSEQMRNRRAFTHCPQGHLYTPENTIAGYSRQRCRICYNTKARRYRARRNKRDPGWRGRAKLKRDIERLRQELVAQEAERAAAAERAQQYLERVLAPSAGVV